jgi:hypothetical protein
MPYDLGDVVPLRFNVTVNGTPTNATSHLLTITLPDQTTVTSSTLTNGTVGQYDYDLATTQAGRHLVRFVTTGTGQAAYTDVFDVRESTPYPVVSLADLRAEVNATATTSDEELRAYLDRATSILEAHCGRVFGRRTLVDTFDVAATDKVVFLRPPVISVTSVVQDGVTLASTSYNFNPTNGILELDGITFNESEVGSVVVTYVAGWTVPPDAVEHAVLRQVAHMWENQRTTPGARRDPNEFTPQYLIPNAVMEALRPFMVPGSAA